jgi:hypothetical protein
MLQQATPGCSVGTGIAVQDNAPNDWDSFLWQIPAQNWLTPANLPWHDWSGRMQDTMMAAPS